MSFPEQVAAVMIFDTIHQALISHTRKPDPPFGHLRYLTS